MPNIIANNIYSVADTSDQEFPAVLRANGGLSVGNLNAGGATLQILQSVVTSPAITSGTTYTFTAANPAGAIILGVTARVMTAVTTAAGTTTLTIGDGSDVDKWGSFPLTATVWPLGTVTSSANFTAAGPTSYLVAGSNVVLTVSGGGGPAFTGGVVRIAVSYIAIGGPAR